MTARGEMLDAALCYRAAGLRPFPCVPGGKGPATAHGFKDGTDDLEQVYTWWRANPDFNVAIPTGMPGRDVLDVDVRPDGAGWAAFNRVNAAGLLAGALALVRTRSGGLHVHFAGTGQSCGSLPRHHLDFKACGGYVLMPPSFVEADGKGPAGRYELLDHRAGTATLDWSAVVRLLDPPRQRRSPVPTRLARPGDLPPSVIRALEAPAPDRSRALHRLVCACARAGLDDAAIHDLAAGYPPALEKYGPRLHAEVERSLRRIEVAR